MLLTKIVRLGIINRLKMEACKLSRQFYLLGICASNHQRGIWIIEVALYYRLPKGCGWSYSKPIMRGVMGQQSCWMTLFVVLLTTYPNSDHAIITYMYTVLHRLKTWDINVYRNCYIWKRSGCFPGTLLYAHMCWRVYMRMSLHV